MNLLSKFKLIQPPEWVIPGAVVQIDFLKKRNWGGRLVLDTYTGAPTDDSLALYNGAPSVLPFTPQSNGVLLASTNVNTPRITDLGWCNERGAYNALYQTRDLTQSTYWTLSGCTVAKDQVGNDTASIASGALSASSVTATSAGGTVLQSVTLSSRPVIGSAQVRRLIGTGTVQMTQDGVNWTDITAQLAAASSASGYIWAQIPMATIANPVFGFKLGTAGDKIAIDLCQLEYINTGVSGFANLQTGSMATSPIANTTTNTNYRANETSYFQNTNAIGSPGHSSAGGTLLNDFFSANGAWSIIASWNGDVTTGGSSTSGPVMLASDMTCPTSIGGGSPGSFGVGNTTGAPGQTSNTGHNGRLSNGGAWNCAAFVVDGNGGRACLNGGPVSSYIVSGWTPSTNPGCTHFNMFNNGAGTVNSPLNGFCGGFAFIKRALEDIEMPYYTDPANGLFITS